MVKICFYYVWKIEKRSKKSSSPPPLHSFWGLLSISQLLFPLGHNEKLGDFQQAIWQPTTLKDFAHTHTHQEFLEKKVLRVRNTFYIIPTPFFKKGGRGRWKFLDSTKGHQHHDVIYIYPTSHNHLQLQRRRRRWADEKILPLSRWRPSAAICFQKRPGQNKHNTFLFFWLFLWLFRQNKIKKKFRTNRNEQQTRR
jgi:hypothetical protein